ncbi:MAG: phosphoribosyltransferase [Cyanobacteria bacterium SZAS LIN-2]|nr:phosphoribosyltransferase [Cyanobacteria bacterium SZAS LIN-3]MBS1997222.1 phosphoribosyltransferase [Cyanobacteria bacterium SZAS LIN-2]
MFANRQEAGKKLAEAVDSYLSSLPGLDKQSDLVVVGLPRGGVPVALEVARKFGCPLEIIVAKKLPYPGQPEYAIGAVSSDGVVVLNPDVPKDYNWRTYVEGQRQILLDKTSKTEQRFYEEAGRNKSSFDGKTVVVVDDGIATGMTAFAALKTVRKRGAGRIIMAVPVMSAQSYRELNSYCDGVVALSAPPDFQAVGQHYVDFAQTSDEEVVRDLRQSICI